MNALEKVFDLLTALTVLFLVPALYYFGGMKMSCTMLAGQTVESFMKRVSTAGEITLPVWMELEEKLNEFGCTEVSLRRERTLYEPVPGKREVLERIYIINTDEMLMQMSETGTSKLRRGDELWLSMDINKVPSVYHETIRSEAEY